MTCKYSVLNLGCLFIKVLDNCRVLILFVKLKRYFYLCCDFSKMNNSCFIYYFCLYFVWIDVLLMVEVVIVGLEVILDKKYRFFILREIVELL